MISTLKYVCCDICGTPAQPGLDAQEARRIARGEGFKRRRASGKMQDLCRDCVRS